MPQSPVIAPEPTPNRNPVPLPPLPKLLTGQVAIVTGANSGIGAAVALALGQAGAHVAVNYVSGDDSAAAVVAQIAATGVKSKAYKADVSDEGQVQAMFAAVIADFGTVDILIANAGLQRDSSFTAMTMAEWQTVLNVNLTGQFLCSREAVKEFVRRGVVPEVSRAAGKIINMSSVHQVIPWGGHVNYATSKGGIHMMMESMAQELAPQRIRINAIAPGAIRTPINTEAWNTPDAYDRLMTLVPYGRIGEPEDIAQTAAWLVSDHADYIVGTTIFIDGGMTLYPGFATNG